MSPTRWPRSTESPSAEVEDDAPRQQAGNLLERDLEAPRPLHDVTTFCSLRSAEAGFMALRYCALLIVDAAEHAADRRAVHMDIKNAEEDADPLPGPFGSGDGDCLGDQAVARRNNQPRTSGNRALRIAEEP